uniref:Uncharacterized protein n=1 Tax=Siphoviridae sp. ctuUw41 TaxID=2826503 RepID=A0A8S5MXV4_9CAUD|nr:MAG TPA: hypothetical protein [Siphoviridae sp. ctuUw41]
MAGFFGASEHLCRRNEDWTVRGEIEGLPHLSYLLFCGNGEVHS